MCITPRSQVIKISKKAQRCASQRGVKLSSVHHTAESNCTPQSQNQILCESLVVFKGTIRRNPFRGEHICHETKYWSIKSGFTKPKMSCTPRSFKFRNLLANISAKSKPNSIIIKPFYLRPGWVRIGKNVGRKTRDSLPLNHYSYTPYGVKCPVPKKIV